MFAIGCIAHYLLTRGQHVFGERMRRDANIVEGKPDTSRISHDVEAEDMILQLIRRDPRAVSVHARMWYGDVCVYI
jgi:serine/threonine-protein kinase/endoribonuclease IRE1